jgi:2-polyprenyl-3-methyl-5-hydroxy-6-metoxy-1,4-benzoquinol methylase
LEQSDFKKQASILSLGSSSDEILASVLRIAIQYNKKNEPRVFDIGCGQGHLLQHLQRELKVSELMGCDYSDFQPGVKKTFKFFTHDCNTDLPNDIGNFDLIVCSEVIEHLENGRHFWRQIQKLLSSNGVAVLSTPNIESLTSLLSFVLRGHHSAFGGKAYPAHINPIASFDMKNMIAEAGLKLLDLYYIPNGRIPGMDIKWSSLLGKFSHRLIADNYVVIATKI